MKKFGIVTLFLAMACVIPASVFGAIIHVPDDEPTIQAGIDAANYLDTVLVADSTWTGPGNKNLDFKGKAITVKSENGPENCIIDCEYEGRGFYFHTNEGVNSVVSGFTITHGSASRGGGIYCGSSSPTITDCIITYNVASDDGGGINCDYYSPTITNCIISYNFCSDCGGGVSFVETNSPTITDCIISYNTANNGGGINCYKSQSTTIKNCTIDNNTSHLGGGIHCNSYYQTITNCTIRDNISDTSNGGGINFNSYPTITNCILWDNTPDEIGRAGGTITVTYSDVQGGYAGDGNIDDNPLFVGANDYHLTSGSPCIDKGTSEGAPDHDIDGDSRPLGNGYDIGSDEFSNGVPPNDCECDLNSDGKCDMQDWLIFGEDWGRTDCP